MLTALLLALIVPFAPHTPPPPAAHVVQVVVVRPGDTLTSIAAAEGLASWHVLYEANAAHIADPDLIFPGERLALAGHETPMPGSYRIIAQGAAPDWTPAAVPAPRHRPGAARLRRASSSANQAATRRS